MSDLLLSANEARVVASLVEKSITLPQYYPMTVNAIMLACNQKTVRNPIMSLSEGDTGAALSKLEGLSLATRDDSSGRVPKWRHRFQHQMLLNAQTQAVLVTLMLRGPQTASELRANAAQLGGPSDLAALNEALQDLADRRQPLVALLARAPGQKEARYAHLLSGTPANVTEFETATESAAPAAAPRADVVAALEARLAALEARVAELEARG